LRAIIALALSLINYLDELKICNEHNLLQATVIRNQLSLGWKLCSKDFKLGRWRRSLFVWRLREEGGEGEAKKDSMWIKSSEIILIFHVVELTHERMRLNDDVMSLPLFTHSHTHTLTEKGLKVCTNSTKSFIISAR
jgi:hypothetical protein